MDASGAANGLTLGAGLARTSATKMVGATTTTDGMAGTMTNTMAMMTAIYVTTGEPGTGRANLGHMGASVIGTANGVMGPAIVMDVR